MKNIQFISSFSSIVLLFLAILATPSLAFWYVQKEDKIIKHIRYAQHYIVSNSWEVRAYLHKATDELKYAWAEDPTGKQYFGTFRRVK